MQVHHAKKKKKRKRSKNKNKIGTPVYIHELLKNETIGWQSMAALEPLKKGEQVFIKYTRQRNSVDTWLQYGFYDPVNSATVFRIHRLPFTNRSDIISWPELRLEDGKENIELCSDHNDDESSCKELENEGGKKTPIWDWAKENICSLGSATKPTIPLNSDIKIRYIIALCIRLRFADKTIKDAKARKALKAEAKRMKKLKLQDRTVPYIYDIANEMETVKFLDFIFYRFELVYRSKVPEAQKIFNTNETEKNDIDHDTYTLSRVVLHRMSVLKTLRSTLKQCMQILYGYQRSGVGSNTRLTCMPTELRV